MKKSLFLLIVIFLTAFPARTIASFGQKLSGRILLAVEAHGEAWYVNPADYKRYYLGRPAHALNLMEKLGIGITDQNVFKIPVAPSGGTGIDTDGDGLSDDLEKTLGTDALNTDSDNDGYSDKTEIENGFDPLSLGKLPVDYGYAAKQAGKIFLQVERLGQAWYVNPADKRRYYLGKPEDALLVMKKLALGVTNADLNTIPMGSGIIHAPQLPQPQPEPQPEPSVQNCQTASAASEVMGIAADAIRRNQISRVISCFTPDMRKSVEYTMNFLDNDGRLTLGNILSGSKQSTQTADQITFDNEIFFSLGGYKVPLHFYVKKQSNGSWLLSNL